MIDKSFIELLACPRCEDRPALTLNGKYLVCTKCRHGYPIIDGIPQLLAEDAISEREWTKNNEEQEHA